MDRKLKIAVIFGGYSSEYPVSLESAHSVIVNLDRDKYELVLLGITKGGEWFRYYGSPEALEDDSWSADRSKCVPAVISPDRDLHGIVEFRMNGVRTTRLDAAFPVLHGRFGEDGTVQGLCELAGIPVIGCGTLSSALCMDKDRAHKLASLAGVDVPRSVAFSGLPSTAELERLTAGLTMPVFVKPVRAGSSFGITRVENAANLRAAVKEALKFDREVIIEDPSPVLRSAAPSWAMASLSPGGRTRSRYRARSLTTSRSTTSSPPKYTCPRAWTRRRSGAFRRRPSASTAPSAAAALRGWTCSSSPAGGWCSTRSTPYPVSRRTAAFPT